MTDRNLRNQDKDEDIKSMNLYKSAHRIYKDLEQLGYSRTDDLNVDDVAKFDQLHFFGIESVKAVIEPLRIDSSSHVLEVGSGLGGPARILAHLTECQVDALELQTDHHEIAMDITDRCKLGSKVKHINENILEFKTDQLYDSIVSWLVFLHIPEKEKLIEKCHSLLKNGGQIYIDDFFKEKPFSDSDKKLLRENIFTEKLLSAEEYIVALHNGGFTDIKFMDETAQFVRFANDRVTEFKNRESHHKSIHGEDVYQQQLKFQQTVADLFTNGSLGGCRIMATKKL